MCKQCAVGRCVTNLQLVKMDNKQIVELTDKELVQELKERRTLLNKMKLNHKVSDIENPMLIRSNRRTVARIKTELTVRRKNSAK